MLDHAGSFVAKVLPWPLQGEAAFVNLHYKLVTLKADGDHMWGGRACRTYDEFMAQLRWLVNSPRIMDIYMCMSTQSQAEVKVTSTGKQNLKAARSGANAVKLRSFYVDIDVKAPPKGYADTQTAFQAFQQFVADCHLPPPTAAVGSGTGGFHAHWALVEPITPDVWRPVAHALARATHELGLTCDSGCTIDAARILRVPETRNFKTDPPNPVALWHLGDHVTLPDMMAALGPYMGKPIAPDFDAANPTAMSMPITLQGNDELTAGIVRESPPIYIDEVAKQCQFIDEAIKTGGANYDNQLWNYTTMLATFCVDGRTQAHRMALGHPTYDPDKTDELYNRHDNKQTGKNAGWVQCEKIALNYPGCKQCPLYIDGKSPLNYGYASQQAQVALQAAAAQPGVSQLPNGYIQTPEGFVFISQQDAEGNLVNIPVMPYPVRDWWLQDNPWVLHFTTAIGGHPLKITAPLKELGPKEGVSSVFSGQGLLFKEKAKPIVKEFMVAWIHKLQQSRDLIVSSTPFGWSEVNGKIEGFTYAGRVWGDKIDRPAATPDATLGKLYSNKGSIEPWMEAAKIITDQGRPDLEAIIAASFGAPLMRFTGHEGAVMNAYSTETGIGKTTAMRTALAVWAHPIQASQGLGDTPLSVIGKMGKLQVMPMFWDEVKTEQQMRNLVELVFTVTGGIEKSRMNSDTTLRERGTWQTLMVTACNDSLIDAMRRKTHGNNAGLVRMFEYEVKRGVRGQISTGEVSRKIGDLQSNYGNAGLVYAQFIGANHERVKKHVGDIQDRLASAVGALNEERFWIATMAVTIAGAMFANELGLININVAALTMFLTSVLDGMREEVKDSPADMRNNMSVSNILAQFLKAQQSRHTLVTNIIHTGVGKPAAGSVIVRSDPSRLDGVHVQIGQDDKKMRISSTYFSGWMQDHEYSRQAFTKAMKTEFGMKLINGKLGGGTQYATALEYLMEIDLSDPRLARFIDP